MPADLFIVELHLSGVYFGMVRGSALRQRTQTQNPVYYVYNLFDHEFYQIFFLYEPRFVAFDSGTELTISSILITLLVNPVVYQFALDQIKS